MRTLWVLLPHGLEDIDGCPAISIIDWAEVIYLAEFTRMFDRPAVVVCGGYTVSGMREADALAYALPSGLQVFLEIKSMNTIEQAENVLRIAKQNNFEKVSLLCWDKHEKRATWTFKRVFEGSGIEIKSTPVSAPYSKLNYQGRLHGPFRWHFWNFLGWVATVKELALSPSGGDL